MASLETTRCFLHETREAAARCPECTRFYCRECVTEHKGQVVCSGCLAEAAPKKKEASGWLRKVLTPVKLVVALVVIWFIFLTAGIWLLEMPSDFRESSFMNAKKVL